jgi:hypothetical protein
MVPYLSTSEFASTSHPGVTATLRKASARRRDKLAEDTMHIQRAVSDLVIEATKLESDPHSLPKLSLIQSEMSRLQNQVIQARLRWGIKELRGLEIDGQPADVEALLEDGPEDLVGEIHTAILANLGLSEDQEKNSELPTTSGDQVAGQTSDTTAATA